MRKIAGTNSSDWKGHWIRHIDFWNLDRSLSLTAVCRVLHRWQYENPVFSAGGFSLI